MKRIAIRAAQSTELDPAFAAVTSVEIEGTLLGQGGFGEVYRARTVNKARPTPQVIKLLIDNGHGLAHRGYETVRELQRRLAAKNAEFLRLTGRSLLDHFPALQAVPQFSFEGVLEGRPVIGYSANDLTAAGFEEFGRILESDKNVRHFQVLPLAARMRIAEQLVSAFHFLSTQALFIHADIKAEALFVNVKRLSCAIIDFDSGALARDIRDKPTTFGTKQDWLAPEILQQLDRFDNSSREVKVDLLSDIWSVNIAVHYLLFGFHPLFFLTEISKRSIDAYFRSCQWPDVPAAFPYFRNEYAAVHNRYITFLRTALPAELVHFFAFTINKGYRDPNSRTTYGQWKTVLVSVNRPSINSFAADRTLVTDNRPVRLSWSVRGAAKLEIPGVSDVTGRTSIDVEVRNDTNFTLILTPPDGAPFSHTIRVEASKDPPGIHSFTTSTSFLHDAIPVRLAWNVTGAELVEIDNGVGNVTGKTCVEVLPRRDTTYSLVATSLFGVKSKSTLHLQVSKKPPVINRFSSDRNFVTGFRPVELIWNVSNDAHEVEIDPVGKVGNTGRLEDSPKRDTTYVLKAASFFGASSQSQLTVCVSKEPPVIERFSATPTFVGQGEEVEIRWKVRGASEVRIEPIGKVPPEGHRKVRLDHDAQLVLSADSCFGYRSTARLGVRLLKMTVLARGALTALKRVQRDR